MMKQLLIALKNSYWAWVVSGALYGVFLRFTFGLLPNSIGGVMSIAFLIGTPVVVGALTIYGRRDKDPTIVFMIFMPWVTMLLMLAGCAVAMLEGAICIVLLLPLFLVCASVGGLAMGLTLRFTKYRKGLQTVALLPFLLILGEGNVPLQNRQIELRQTVLVQAEPEVVWHQILNARNIRPEEMEFNVPHFIGVPKPVEGVNVLTPGGEVRYSKWERGVNFQGVVTNREEFKSIGWKYAFNAHSFPNGSMDEHVAVGGKYFDLLDTTFNLHRVSNHEAALEIVAHYRVTSSINFYSIPASKFLGNEFIHAILTLYKNRSEGVNHA